MYKFYVDPGHGWLAVKRAELVKLGIIDRISGYSYQKGKTVYLEEDCDASRFVNAKGWNNEDFTANVTVKYHEGSSPIRSYNTFHA